MILAYILFCELRIKNQESGIKKINRYETNQIRRSR